MICQSCCLFLLLDFKSIFFFFGSQSRNRVQQSPPTFCVDLLRELFFIFNLSVGEKKVLVINQSNHFQDESQHYKYKVSWYV